MKVTPGIAALVISAISVTLQAAPAPPYCGDLGNRFYQPYDYNDPEHKSSMLHLVDTTHFTSNIENLQHGNSGSLGGELSYTLMMFPNHHRALAAFGKLSLRDKTLKPVGAKYSVGCFFDRAIRFRPTDGMVRMVYGNYLLKAGKTDDAIKQFQVAIGLQPEDPTINYNLGLLYMQKKDYEQAKTFAKKAYGLGFPLPGLKNQLIQAGKWED